MFLAWRTVHAKALRQECAWCIGGTAREPVWLERSKGSNGVTFWRDLWTSVRTLPLIGNEMGAQDGLS